MGGVELADFDPASASVRSSRLRASAPGSRFTASLTAPVAQILPTRPLARVTLAADPPLTALLLHRDLQSLRPQPGQPITVTVPSASVRIFSAAPDTA